MLETHSFTEEFGELLDPTNLDVSVEERGGELEEGERDSRGLGER